MEPYNPNKSFIHLRLNPDAIKEELISFIPYNRTLRHIYNNPEGDIRETAKIAAYETPILGSLLAGEPTDAVKEAFLMGLPMKSANKVKADVLANPQRKYINASGDLIYADPAKPGSAYYAKDDSKFTNVYADIMPYKDNKSVIRDIEATEEMMKDYTPLQSNANTYNNLAEAEQGAKDYISLRKTKLKPEQELYVNNRGGGNVIVWNKAKNKGIHYKIYGGLFGSPKYISRENNVRPGQMPSYVLYDDNFINNKSVLEKKLNEDIKLFNAKHSYGGELDDWVEMNIDNAWEWQPKLNKD